MKLGQVDEITTANIGKFHGGSATNIVADEVILGSRGTFSRSRKNKNTSQTYD